MRNLTFKEACAAVADLYEAIPETYCVGYFAQDENDKPVGMWWDKKAPLVPSAVKWCVLGGVSLATGRDVNEIDRLFMPFSDGDGAAHVSNGSRLEAIAMLRRAAEAE